MKLLIILSVFIFNSPYDAGKDQLLPTKLRVTVIDEVGNFVEGANVSIYESEKDYLASENPITTDTTDKKGRVTFTDLNTIAYFIEAKEGNRNNNSEGVKTGELLEGRINKVNTVIE